MQGDTNQRPGQTHQQYLGITNDQQNARMDAQIEQCKIIFGGHWLESFAQALGDGHAKVVLELGPGSGTWCIEAATAYPNTRFTGVDLVPPTPSRKVPSNVRFVEGDFVAGLPADDDTVDVIYAALVMSGIPTGKWDSLMAEIHRVLKPGGLIYFVEAEFPMTGLNARGERGMPDHAGWREMHELVAQCLALSDRDTDAAYGRIPRLLRDARKWKEPGQDARLVPAWCWSDDPAMLEAGKLGKAAFLEYPINMKAFATQKFGLLTEAEFDEKQREYETAFDAPGVKCGRWYVHNWAYKA